MSGKIVLVIEDNEKNLKLFRALLEAHDHRVLEARDAESALACLKQDKPDLILMDIQLPGMDGYEATCKLKQDPDVRDIPVLALTAYAMQGDREKALAAGCDGYISKPIDIQGFLDQISLFLDEKVREEIFQARKLPPYRKRILIVDDEPRNLRLLSAMISDKFNVIAAESGEEALDKAASEHPDVILLDVMMPGMDGFEVAQRLKSDAVLKNIPIIMVTALTDKENKIAGLASGAEEYLNKPVRRVELLTRINSMLRLREYRDQLAIRSQSEQALPESLEEEESALPAGVDESRVLLVEDNEIDARIIMRSIQNESLHVQVVQSGRLALEHIEKNPVDAVLLDILLPDIDGFEICRRIKKMERGQDLPIIVITCLDDLESRLTGISLGTDDFLVKPINGDELVARLRILLEKKKQLDTLRSHYETALNSAIIDWMTGLYNHGYFKKFLDLEIKRSLRQNYPVSLLMIDVDDFKAYNDNQGHTAGDEILRDIGLVLKKSIREIDLAARYGGDEFTVVLPYSPGGGAVKVARRIQQTLRDFSVAQDTGNSTSPVTVSIGIASFPDDALSVEELIQRADEMLYRSKRGGRGCVYRFEPETAEKPEVMPERNKPGM
jgi:two-component system cell cycle response regulator